MTAPAGGELAPSPPAPTSPKPAGLGRNALFATAGNVIHFGVVILITPLAIHRLGEEGWGIWQLVGAAVIYAQLLTLSLGTAVHYEVSTRIVRHDHEGLAALLTSVRIYLLGAGVVLLVLLALGGRAFVDFVVSDSAHRALAWSALVVSIVLTAIDFQLRLFGSVLAGLQRMDLYGLLQIVSAVLLGAAIWFGFERGMGVTGFSALMTLGPGAAGALSIFAARRLLPRAALAITRFDGALLRRLMDYSFSTILYATGSVVLYQTMKLVAARYCGGPVAAGHLGLAISVVQILSVVFTPPVAVLQSRVGQLSGEGRLDAVPPLLERVILLLGLALVPSVVFVALDAELVFRVWLGGTEVTQSLDTLATTTRMLLVGHGLYIAALPFYFVLLGVGQHRVFGLGMMAIAVLNTVVGVAAAAFWPAIEALGVTYGVLMLALVVCVNAPAALRLFPLSVPRLIGRGLLLPALLSLPGVAGVWLRPRFGHALADFVTDGVLYSALTLPLLELARRRQRLGLRG